MSEKCRVALMFCHPKWRSRFDDYQGPLMWSLVYSGKREVIARFETGKETNTAAIAWLKQHQPNYKIPGEEPCPS